MSDEIKSVFAENEEGVHLLSPINAEYTLCGDAFDGQPSDFTFDYTHTLEHERTARRTVTCERCIQVILRCRGVRIKSR